MLSTLETLWRDKFSPRTISELSYEVEATGVESGVTTETRNFASESARNAFLVASFGTSKFEQVDAERFDDAVHYNLDGCELASVTFVRDYVQLGFDGPTLTFILLPRVRDKARVVQPTTPGYRDALCDLIGRRVSSFDLWLDVGIAVDFADRSVELPPNMVPLEAVEAGLLEVEGSMFVWRIGETQYLT